MMQHRRRHGRRSLVALSWLVTVALAAGAAWWGAKATLEPPALETKPAEVVFVAVSRGTAGRTVTFGAVGTWRVARSLTNSAEGVVTSVGKKPGDIARSGDVLYAVNLAPVVALPGIVPAFRDMTVGDKGPDVRQIQKALAGLGFNVDTDGRYGRRTANAVKEWQKKLGADPTGSVPRTSVLFIPQLPARVTYSPEITPGGVVGPGTGSVQVLEEQPSFSLDISPEQANLVPLNATALIDAGDGTTQWPARLGAGVVDSQSGAVRVPLLPTSGGAVCGTSCSLLAGRLEQAFAVEIVLVPKVTGPMVPLAAVQTLADGTRQVVLRDGTAKPVTIKAESNGRAVVDGVAEGTEVQLFAPAQGQG